MEIVINKSRASSLPQKLGPPQNFNDKKFGQWGRVDNFYSEDNSVDVILDTGIFLKRVPVASMEWVVSGTEREKEYNSGERNLPPKFSRVFVIMPSGIFDDAFVLCSGFNTIEQTKPFLDEEKTGIKERVTLAGWHITNDNATGSYKAVSPDGKTSFNIDYGDGEVKSPATLTVSVFDTDVKLTHTAGESVEITAFGTELTIKNNGDVSLKCEKLDATGQTMNLSASDNIKLESSQVEITGGQFDMKGVVTPSASGGPLCAFPNCLFTGGFHAGSRAVGT